MQALFSRYLRVSHSRLPYHATFSLSVAPSITLCRFSSTRTTTDAEEKPKPKPKASTPLRRSASASQSIRATTRSEILPVLTLATAEKYLLARLRTQRHLLPPASRILNDAYWVPKWAPPSSKGKEGEIFIFSNGSFVCWGLDEQDAQVFAKTVIGRVNGVEVAPLKEAQAETEELEFVTDPAEPTRLQGDLIILGQTKPPDDEEHVLTDLPSTVLPPETLLARYAFSQALSRSTALSVLEESLDNYLSSMARLPHSLEQTGKPGLGRTALIKKLGQLMKLRQGLNLNRENFIDVPDFYWTEPELERYFKSMSDALEVKTRTHSVNDKIDYATEAQAVLRQLLTESSSHNLEVIIIALIAVEVVIAFIRDGPELWQILKGERGEENRKAHA